MATETMTIDCPECGEILSAPQCRPGACGLLDAPQPSLSAAVETLEKLVAKWREEARFNLNRKADDDVWEAIAVQQDQCADDLESALQQFQGVPAEKETR